VVDVPFTPEALEQGTYVRPTVFAEADDSLRIAREEIFGPVLVIVPFEDDEDAVRISRTTRRTASAGVCGPPTGSAAWPSRAGSVAAPSWSTAPVAASTRPSAAARTAAQGRESGPTGLGHTWS
jgi:aldehyde dehydrogenase (NAD+)